LQRNRPAQRIRAGRNAFTETGLPAAYLPDFLRLSSLQSIWQFFASVFLPFKQK
jgi:hypothetical protein